jgi:hypothetical protein
MCQRFDVTGNLKNFAKFSETKQGLAARILLVAGKDGARWTDRAWDLWSQRSSEIRDETDVGPWRHGSARA